MKLILILTLLALANCYYRHKFYLNKNEQTWLGIPAECTAIAMLSSSTRISMNRWEYFNFVIGTDDGLLHFGSSESYGSYSTYVTDFGIRNLTWVSGNGWDNQQIRIATKYQIKVISPKFQSKWNLLSMRFNEQIKNAVFGSKKYLIMTAISFSDRIQVFQNTTSIYNISINQPCFAMTFKNRGNYFYFITREISNGPNIMKRLEISTLTIYNTGLSSPYSQNSLQFSPAPNYSHLAFSTNSHSYVVWDLQEGQATEITSNIDKIKFLQGGQQFISKSTTNTKSNSIKIKQINYNSMESTSYFYQPQTLDQYSQVIDMDTKGQKIFVLIPNCRILFYSDRQNTPSQMYHREPSKPSHLWIIIVGSILGFLLFLGIVGVIIRRKRIRKQLQQGNYVQQTDVSEVTPSQDSSDAKNAIQLNERLFNKEEFNENEGFNINCSAKNNPYGASN